MKDLKEIVINSIIEVCEEINFQFGFDMDKCDEQSLSELSNEELVDALIQIVEILSEKRFLNEEDDDEIDWGDETFGTEKWGEDEED